MGRSGTLLSERKRKSHLVEPFKGKILLLKQPFLQSWYFFGKEGMPTKYTMHNGRTGPAKECNQEGNNISLSLGHK
jgi:hypothetical protein